MGNLADDEAVVLAKLSLLADTLSYEMFDQHIEFEMSGAILTASFPALTYR